MSAGGRLRVGFVVYPGFTGLDLVGPHEVLVRIEEAECLLAGSSLEPVASSGGLRFVPDHTFAGCPSLDVLVVPGGPGQGAAMDDRELISFLAERAAQAAWTAGVCTGALLLAQAGVLRGRRATTHHRAYELLRPYCREVVTDQRIVDEGRVVTAGGVSSSLDLGLYLVERHWGAPAREQIAAQMEYRGYPVLPG